MPETVLLSTPAEEGTVAEAAAGEAEFAAEEAALEEALEERATEEEEEAEVLRERERGVSSVRFIRVEVRRLLPLFDGRLAAGGAPFMPCGARRGL